MKTKMNVQSRFGLVAVFLFFLIAGCKEDLTQDPVSIKSDLLMGSDVFIPSSLNLRQSPGLKFKVTSKTVARISPDMKGKDKLNEILKSRNPKKSKSPQLMGGGGPGVFTATLNSGAYLCHGIMPTAEPYDWYLVNENTMVYTYIGSTTDGEILFWLDKPYFEAQFMLIAEGYNTEQTNHQTMGDPVTGVTLSSGRLEFSSPTDVVALHERLSAAYDAHSAAFFDANSSLSDDDLDALITSTGFDEDLPLIEFEAYIGLSSYRASIAAGEEAYMNGLLAYDPDTAAVTADDILRTMLNSSASLQIEESIMDYTQSGPFGEPCYTYLRKKLQDPYASGKIVKNVGEWHGAMLLFFEHSVSKTKSRKVKSGGGWKKWPAEMDGGFDGTMYEQYCADPEARTNSNKAQSRRRVFLNSKVTLKNGFRFAHEEGMTSRHYIAGHSYNLALVR